MRPCSGAGPAFSSRLRSRRCCRGPRWRAEGFVADVEYYPNAQLLFLGADGAPRSVYSIVGRSAVAATNGRETVVIYSLYAGAEVDELWGIVFAADGTIRRQPQRLGIARRSLYPAHAIWDGSQYLVAIDSSPTAKLLRVSQTGDAIGDLIELNSEGAQGLAANGSDVLVLTSGAGGVLLRGTTLDTPRAVSIWQAARTQAGVTITAGGDQYLGAWAERSGKNWMIRASRIDAEGNYLDGGGLLLGTMPSGLRFPPAIATASDGRDFIVAWGERATNAARVSSSGAVLDSPPLMIAANGEEFDVAWNGASYIVVYTVSIFDAGPRRGLYRASITREGSVSPPLLIADMRDEPIPDGSVSYLTFQLSLAILDGEGLVVFQQHRNTCRGEAGHHCFGGTSTQSTVEGLRLDGNGAAAGRPFTIAAGVPAGPRWLSSTGGVAVASDGASYLVLWSQPNGVVGTLIPTGPQPPATSSLFGVAPSGYRPSLAFDGRDYVAAWESFSAEEIFTARLSRTGNVLRVLRWPAEEGERVTWAIVATNAKLPPLIAFTAPGFSGAVTRGGMLFESEFEPAGAPPRRPLLLGAARNDDDTVTVQWQRADDVLGVLIELQLVDGSYRTMGAVAPIASTARVPLAGLNGLGVRVRTWNSSGDSEPFATILFSTKRRAAR